MFPKISIIMGIYNCEKYLSDSIDSIINQTFKNWELIMCDDDSKDSTYEIADRYRKKYPDKIILLKNKCNLGLNMTLNRCLEVAKGEYIARQDGDDVSCPTRLEKQLNFLENNEIYGFIGTNMDLFDENGKWGEARAKEKPLKKNFIRSTPFFHATCMIRKDILNEVGGYTVDKNLLRVEDYHLWFKIYSKGYRGYNLNENLYKARDDRDATCRRTIQNRINEAKVKYIGFKMLGISKVYYIYILKPLILILFPVPVYEFIRRRKLSKRG